jgi:hypothetical protein
LIRATDGRSGNALAAIRVTPMASVFHSGARWEDLGKQLMRRQNPPLLGVDDGRDRMLSTRFGYLLKQSIVSITYIASPAGFDPLGTPIRIALVA